MADKEETPFLIETGFKGKKIKANMDELLTIDDSSPDAIADQLKANAKHMFYWGSLAEFAIKRQHEVENDFKMWYAGKHKEAKESILENGDIPKSKLTEAMVQNEVILNNTEEWEQFQKAINAWGYRASVLTVAARAYTKKGDALVNLLSYHKKTYEQEEN